MFMVRWIVATLVLAFVQGCVIAPAAPERQGPPAQAPAQGYRSQHRYFYYPEASVYFDLDRRVYFYLDSGWRSAMVLPQHLQIRLGAPVTLQIGDAMPYRYYDEHRHTYPPGQPRKNTKWQ